MPSMLWPIIYSTPLLIVYLLAAVLGVVNLKKHGAAARIAVCGGLLAATVVICSLSVQSVLWANAAGWPLDAVVSTSNFVGVGARVVESVGTAMIVFAVFAGRRPVRGEDGRGGGKRADS